MTALISLFIAIILSILVTRIATVAFRLTGLSREVAQFQALSAFTGVGFTTTESEHIINHPARRRIVTIVIRLGNVGLVTVISSLVLTFVNVPSSQDQTMRFIWLSAGLLFLFFLSRSDWIDTHLSRLIQTILRRYTDLDVQDYASLLGIRGGYRLAEFEIKPDSWLADKTLAEADVAAEGILILGIKRPDGNYVGAPQGQTSINQQDRLVVYGHEDAIAQISHRLHGRSGDRAHQMAMSKQDRQLREQQAKDHSYSDYSQTD